MEKILEKAIQFAEVKHKGQLDDTGKDYFENHCLQVLGILAILVPEDVNLLCAAVLHDTLEDTKTTLEELCTEFGIDISSLVQEVSHNGSKDSNGYYFPNLHSKRGIILKFADRLSNLTRMQAWDIARQEQYLRKSKFWKSEIKDK
jgi:(p)ppGpp synthase/HD superfamily hydrolase